MQNITNFTLMDEKNEKFQTNLITKTHSSIQSFTQQVLMACNLNLHLNTQYIS